MSLIVYPQPKNPIEPAEMKHRHGEQALTIPDIHTGAQTKQPHKNRVPAI